ncbi:Thymidylate kinase [Tetrabaena socialis]|uniref:Thymidylate kinase n=1 Tax=Tetrabaena socialis TaxID=47790 RepID=A0A2J8AA83_9CHLO|nr:Thymidylate kinase [Tetrabaena socialis]|eukprot:PNH09393.1 Thymidylate kinase [Tetrabaena socialis]
MTSVGRTRGALIVFEGGDRCGKTTQCGKLVERLQSQGVDACMWRFPDRSTAIGQAINAYLAEHSSMDDAVIHMLFVANRLEKREEMLQLLAGGTTLVLDRYSYSGVAYTAAKGVPHLSLEYCKSLEVVLPAADLVLHMSMTAEATAARGGYGEERYEKVDFQRKVMEIFGALRDDRWAVVDASSTIEAIHEQVVATVMPVVERARGGAPLGRLWDYSPLGLPLPARDAPVDASQPVATSNQDAVAVVTVHTQQVKGEHVGSQVLALGTEAPFQLRFEHGAALCSCAVAVRCQHGVPNGNGTHAPRGALIAFEGGDRCGKSTQSKLLADTLRGRGGKVEQLNFPDRSTPIGMLVDDYLRNKSALDDAVIHLLFTANRFEKRNAMLQALAGGTTLVLDRYSYSGVAYTGAKGVPHLGPEYCRSVEVGLPAADLVVFMDISPEESAARGGYGQERYEKVAQQFHSLMDQRWLVLDAGAPEGEIHAKVLAAALPIVEQARRGAALGRLWDDAPLELPRVPISVA